MRRLATVAVCGLVALTTPVSATRSGHAEETSDRPAAGERARATALGAALPMLELPTTTAPPTTAPPPPDPAAEARLRAARARARAARTAAATPSGDGIFHALARCESGGNPHAHSPSGRYHGAFQFSLPTWQSLGYAGDPHDYPYDVQLAAAKRLQARSGWGQWPACARRLGLL